MRSATSGPERPGELGKDDFEDSGLEEEVERPAARGSAAEAVDLLEDSRRRRLRDLPPSPAEGGEGRRLDLEIQPCGELDGAKDPDRVLANPAPRRARASDAELAAGAT